MQLLSAIAAGVVAVAGCSNAGTPGDDTEHGPPSSAGRGGADASSGGGGGVTSTGAAAGSGGVAAASGSAGSSHGSGTGGVGTSGMPGSAGAAAGGSTALGGMGGAVSQAGSAPVAGTGDAGGRGGNGGQGGRIASGGRAGAGGTAGGSAGAGAGSAGAAGSTNSCPPATPPTGGKQYCSNTKGNVNGGYAYELWSSGTGSGCMTVYSVDATFSATWTKVDDFLARIGLGFDQTKTPTQIGTISADFAETKTTDDGLVYVGIYGWTVSPLREYYIIDDWGSMKPADTASDGTPRTHVGTISVDGDTYDVWKHTQVNKPAITGNNQTFDQYFSVRQTARQCGHISISQHFSEWTKLNLDLGKLEEAKLLVESQSSTGKIDFTTATVVVK